MDNIIKTKYKFHLVILLVIGIIFTSISPKLLVNAADINVDSNGYAYGDYSLTFPEGDSTYSAKFQLVLTMSNGNILDCSGDAAYYIEVLNADGTVNADKSAYYKFVGGYNNAEARSDFSYTLTNIPAGSTVTVKDIKVVKHLVDQWGGEIWGNYASTQMQVNVTDEVDSKNTVVVDDVTKLKELVVGETVAQTCKLSDTSFDRETSDTLLSVSGHSSYYDEDFLTYLLSAYNVVSLDEIHSTHIVGPIISQNIAERTTENGSVAGYLAASDYSKGVPSYVGEFTYYNNTSGKADIGVKFNYDFDDDHVEDFVPPYVYSEKDRLSINVKADGTDLLDYYVLLDRTEVISANAYGYAETYQNNNFINFNDLEAALKQASQNVLESGNAELYDEYVTFEFDTDGTLEGSTVTVNVDGEEPVVITYNNGETYKGRGFSDFVSYESYFYQGTNLRLTAGMEESWTIKNAKNLVEVNLLMPEDYDYYNNPHLQPTTINFECEYINPVEYQVDVDGDGVKETVTHSQMPYTLIDGDEFDGKRGENGEYGEVGNKIIWNMPNVETNSETGDNRLTVAYSSSHNIAGHIVAPGAEFWNYSTDGSWLGGNLNGAAIVKSFYSGIMEMHMWPYEGLSEKNVVYGVEALKTVNGNKPEREYKFVLDLLNPEEGIPDGVLNNTFPMLSSSRTDKGEEGVVKFSSLAFNKEGTYSFVVYEDTSIDTGTDNVTFDRTKYQIDITITSDVIRDVITYKVSQVDKYRIADSNGNLLAEPELITHDRDEVAFKFDNKTSQEGIVDLTLYKKSTGGGVLEGAKFYVTEMNEDGTETLTDGYFERVVSDKDGKIYIAGLEKDKYYKLEEYESAYGHVVQEGYWVFKIGPNGFLISMEEFDGAPEIADDLIIYNKPAEWAQLDLTLTKTNEVLDLLSDVEFRLQRVVIDKNGVPQFVVDGYDVSYTTAADGTFTITDLLHDHTYMLTEVSVPTGHKPHNGYWLIEVSGDQITPNNPLTYTITEYDNNHKVVREVTDDVILNDLLDYVLPTTGGIGTNLFNIIGLVLILSSLCLLGFKFKAENKKFKKVRVLK